MPEVYIESLAYGGDGVAHLDDGRVVFVRGGCPGDRVEIEITAEHDRRANGRIISVLSPAPERTRPPCPHFGECGGCQWQHVNRELQLSAKTRIVSDALRHIAHAEPLVSATESTPARYGYRNKVELECAEVDGRLHLGYHALGSKEFIPTDRCLLLPKGFEDAPKALAGALRFLSGRHGALGVRRVGLRVSTRTGDVEVALWTDPAAFPRQMAAKTLGDAVGACGVVRLLVKDAPQKRLVTGVEVLSGRGSWTEELCGRRLSVSAPSFFQLNTAAAEALATRALRLADTSGQDRVLDMYSGVGTFTLPLAATGAEVVAVESSRYALADLRRNLGRANLDADIVGGDATRELPALGEFDVVLVDPPRSGLQRDAILALAATGARTIVYVSCDPATLARDAERLLSAGYRLNLVEPHDLFPQTYHVECIASFSRHGS